MGSKVRESVENAKEEANAEINKCRTEIGKMSTIKEIVFIRSIFQKFPLK